MEVCTMRHTILVIDDQWSMQELARVVLQSAGYRVLLADDSASGLTLARTEHPDVIVMDLRMPEVDLTDFLQGLQRESATAAIPVIFIASDCIEDRLMHHLTTTGQATCLTKPFPPPALVTMVEGALKRPRQKMAV
jgi:CheY-like chemotaxis protein